MISHEKIILPFFCLLYVYLGVQIMNPTMQTLSLMGWLGLMQLLYSILSWLKRGNQLISPYVIFLITLYIFSFGQSFLWALGFEFERTLIGYKGIVISEVFEAQVLTLIMLAFFQIGASNIRTRRVTPESDSIIDTSKRLKEIGWTIFVISILPYSIETYQNMVMSLSGGYGALYSGPAKIGISNWAGIIADYCIPSLICLFIAYRQNKRVRYFITLFFIVNIIVILITGGRTFAVILLALIIVLYNYLVHKFSKKWLFIGAIGGLFFLQLLSFIAEVRVERDKSISVEAINLEKNGAVDAIAEMGSSMFCLIKTMNLVPDYYDYRYGRSYAFAFTSLIPNLGFWDIHPAKKEANLSDWLSDTLGLDYGTGFSMCAEAYANFGYLCFIVFFFWGWFIANIFGKIEVCVLKRDYALLAFLLILFWFFLTLPRNNFINLIRPLFFIAGPIYLYCKKHRVN